jgi:flagellar assembly protein FliH
MAPRIIKQGTAQSAFIQPMSFAENFSDPEAAYEPAPWPELSAEPAAAPAQVYIDPEPAATAVDLARLEKTAYENGFHQGEKAGMEIAERKIDAIMKRYTEAIVEVGKLRASLYGQIEQEVVKLALAVSKKIVHREIQVDRDIIQTLVRVALSHVAEKSSVVIHLNPVDYSYLLDKKSELSQSEGRDISLLADRSVERGGCLIQTDCGDIDARIDEEFREVERTFFEGMK